MRNKYKLHVEHALPYLTFMVGDNTSNTPTVYLRNMYIFNNNINNNLSVCNR